MNLNSKILEVLNEYNQNLEGYSYYGIVNGVSEDDYTEVSEKVANLDYIKELEAKNVELESYKRDWQEVAGKANLKHLVAKNDELESIIKNLEEKIEKMELSKFLNNEN